MRLQTLVMVLTVACAAPVGAQHAHGSRRSSGNATHTPRVATPRAPSVRAPSTKSYQRSTTPKAPRSATPHAPKASQAAPGARDSRGRLERSAKAKDDFMRSTGHPRGWPGHVVDHIVPLACGGADSPSNMQWQTSAEAKAKDKVERKGCGR
jgi:hypothetical protein